ncbi:ASCH domain-containing protein [Streptomyces sp. NBC_00091]|uniref:ASCH domain-containing protein n=1 Tax=Streptomyces sp. NBC_00091 TaxID=2975648 RepID=UPI0022523DEF|nr:ASCH domain-containing protein [Streptomyces sp. NBC_00091]MCX5379252.1 ASCH domain-containing protein [Streptomyces sp. NBC_00091]
MTSHDDLRPFELGFPGEQRDRLVAAVLSGAKTTTTGLLGWYEAEGEPLPRPGERLVLVDSGEQPLAVLEMTEVRVLRLAEVELRHALDEGEGFASVAEWRSAHEGFWHSEALRAELGDPQFTADDDTLVVAERFRLL